MEYTVGSKSVGNLKAKVTKADHNMVPQVIFTDPQVAFVGLTEQSAKGLGLNTCSVDSDIGTVDGAKLHTDGYVGHARLIWSCKANYR